MSFFKASDGTNLFYEETGEGHPIVFVHEFAGDARSYELQVRYFSRSHRCIVYNARGYPPSDVPNSLSAYSQSRARDDLLDLIQTLGLKHAHVVGLSMGGFAALHAAIRLPNVFSSLVVAGSGYGSYPPTTEKFRRDMDAIATNFRSDTENARRLYASGPTRVQFERKDRRGYQEFVRDFLAHSTDGSANTLLGVQRDRPSLWDLASEISAIRIPTLITVGDEDEGCLEAAVFLKRTIQTAGLLVLPNTGHTLNLEEPSKFNAALDEFFFSVQTNAWRGGRKRP